MGQKKRILELKEQQLQMTSWGLEEEQKNDEMWVSTILSFFIYFFHVISKNEIK